MSASLRRKAIALAWLLTVSAFPGVAAANLVTLDFEDVPVGDYNGAFVSNGIVLDPGAPDQGGALTGHYHIEDPTVSPIATDNPTKYLLFDYIDNSILNIASLSGGIFGIQQFDLAPKLTPGLTPIEFTFTGHLAGGGTITRLETVDMITDGIVKFKTYEFDSGWDQLTMFTIFPSHQYANPGIDNIVIRTVPEPGAAALLALGLVGLAFGVRRERSRTGGSRFTSAS